MLSLAREYRGLTQNQLVEKVPNLNQGNYSKMEKGLIGVPKEALENISKELNFPLSFFYKYGVHTPVSSFYFRKRASLTKKSLSLLEAKLNVLRICIDELIESVELPEFNLPYFEITDECSPSDVARKLRDFLKIPQGPVKNLVRLLEARGVIVYFIKIDSDKFDGITLKTDKGQPIIFINSSLPNDRKRFTIVHELFHLLVHIPFSPVGSHRDVESEADEGTGEFLMPMLDCRMDLYNLKYSNLSVLKAYWGVSKAMVLYRAKEIGAITTERCTNLFIELSKNGERKKESDYIDLEEPTLLNLIINSFEEEMEYSFDDMVEMLSLSKTDYLSLFEKSKYSLMVRPRNVVEFKPKIKTAW